MTEEEIKALSDEELHALIEENESNTSKKSKCTSRKAKWEASGRKLKNVMPKIEEELAEMVKAGIFDE